MNQAQTYLKDEIEKINKAIEDNKSLLVSENDPELKKMVEDEITNLEKQKKSFEDSLNATEGNFESTGDESGGMKVSINPNICMLEIRAGTGGDEAGLFAKDLLIMYSRYAEKKGWKMEEEFSSENEAGGIKTIMVQIKGLNVYELLKNESGVHRVQRVPVTEAGGRIHTSTATVAVMPELKKVEIEIKPDDLKWDFFRAGGKGGQNVNKVSTAVRLTHIPTQTIVECREERFQGKNREKALNMLQSRIYTRMQEEHVKSVTDLRAAQVGTGDRSEKIRTYNFPQDRVTDHRIGVNWHGINFIMNGEIDNLLKECAEKLAEGAINATENSEE